MFQRPFYRAFSFALAALLTVGILSGIDQLSQPGVAAGTPQWAQQTGSARA